MSMTCWYCKKQLGEEAYAMRIPLTKQLDAPLPGDGSTPAASEPIGDITPPGSLLEDEVIIPRCRECGWSHWRSRMIITAAVLIVILIVVLPPIALYLAPETPVDPQANDVLIVSSIAWTCFALASPVIIFLGILAGKQYLRRKNILLPSDSYKHPDLLARQAEGWVISRKRSHTT
jgi:hypothetical protein